MSSVEKVEARPDIIHNRYGFWEIRKKPTDAFLQKFYAEKYFQEASGGYASSYSSEEIRYFCNKIDQKYRIIQEIATWSGPPTERCMLDIGCGEGWTLAFFRQIGWQIRGLDYGSFGCEKHNPHCQDAVQVGNIYESLSTLVQERERFHCIWLDNVLEHVREPATLVETCRALVHEGGVLVIEVPNDFSAIQEYLLTHGSISHPFWVTPPAHLNYFNREGLETLCAEKGWRVRRVLGDYPIDLDLLNPNSNYIEKPEVGKASHQARVAAENLLHALSPEKTNALYEQLAALGLGRQIIGFFSPT